MQTRPPQIDMDLEGRFRQPAGLPPGAAPGSALVARIIRGAVIVAVVSGALAVAMLAFWFALALIPVAIGAALVAYAAFRFQLWRSGRSVGGGSVGGQGRVFRPPFGRPPFSP